MSAFSDFWNRLINLFRRNRSAVAMPEPPRTLAPISYPTEHVSAEKSTTGIRNKNLLNIKGSGWRGVVGYDSRGHAIFPTYALGLRAAVITLRTYWRTHRLRTVAEILSRWAPASDTIGSIKGAPPNSPKAYADFVCKRVGVGPNEVLSIFGASGELKNRDQLFRLVAAMAAYENYASFDLRRGLFDSALELV